MSDYADLCESMGQDPSDPDAIDNMIDMCHGDAIDDDDDDFVWNWNMSVLIGCCASPCCCYSGFSVARRTLAIRHNSFVTAGGGHTFGLSCAKTKKFANRSGDESVDGVGRVFPAHQRCFYLYPDLL